MVGMVDGVPTYRLDLAYPKAKIAIEYDGEEFHSSAEARAADEMRRAFLRSAGWVVIVVGKHSFADEALEQWIGVLREALAVARTRPRRIYR